jgi:hypothetical protein
MLQNNKFNATSINYAESSKKPIHTSIKIHLG